MLFKVVGQRKLSEQKEEEAKGTSEEIAFHVEAVKYVRRTKEFMEINFKPEFFIISNRVSEKPFKVICPETKEYDNLTKLISQYEQEQRENRRS